MFRFGRPPSHTVSSLTLISGTTLECRVISTIRAGEHRLLLRQGRSYLYDPGTCKCLRKFSGSARKKISLRIYVDCFFLFVLPINCCNVICFVKCLSSFLFLIFNFLFFLFFCTSGIFFFCCFVIICDFDRKSERGKVDVIRGANTSAAVFFPYINLFDQFE